MNINIFLLLIMNKKNNIDTKSNKNQEIREKLWLDITYNNIPLLYFSIPFKIENDFFEELKIDKGALNMSLNWNKFWAFDLTKIDIYKTIELLNKILKESYSKNKKKLILMDSTKITYIPPIKDNFQEPIHEFWIYQGNFKYMLEEIKKSLESKESIKEIYWTINETREKVKTIWFNTLG